MLPNVRLVIARKSSAIARDCALQRAARKHIAVLEDALASAGQQGRKIARRHVPAAGSVEPAAVLAVAQHPIGRPAAGVDPARLEQPAPDLDQVQPLNSALSGGSGYRPGSARCSSAGSMRLAIASGSDQSAAPILVTMPVAWSRPAAMSKRASVACSAGTFSAIIRSPTLGSIFSVMQPLRIRAQRSSSALTRAWTWRSDVGRRRVNGRHSVSSFDLICAALSAPRYYRKLQRLPNEPR